MWWAWEAAGWSYGRLGGVEWSGVEWEGKDFVWMSRGVFVVMDGFFLYRFFFSFSLSISLSLYLFIYIFFSLSRSL